MVTSIPAPPAGALLCYFCLRQGAIRQAWSVADGFAACVRHVVEGFEQLDDMDQHDLYVVLYQKLRNLDYPTAY